MVLLKTDNMATAMVLQSGCGRDPLIMQAARDVWWHEAVTRVKIVPIHVAGTTLVLVDALSRRTISGYHTSLSDRIVANRNLRRVYMDPFDILTHYEI